MKEASYNLSIDIASHDYFFWQIEAQHRGYQRIVFNIKAPKTDKWTPEVSLERFRSIIQPGPELSGLEYRIGEGGDRFGRPFMGAFVQFVHKNPNFRRLRGVRPPKTERYTITIRNTERAPGRNSNRDAWEKFANEIGAFIIPDYDDQPMHQHERMAYYEGAEMNFGVCCGPLTLATLSDHNVMMFDAKKNEKGMVRCGVPVGTNLPWMRGDQHLIWAGDDYDTLMRTFEKWHGEKVQRPVSA